MGDDAEIRGGNSGVTNQKNHRRNGVMAGFPPEGRFGGRGTETRAFWEARERATGSHES